MATTRVSTTTVAFLLLATVSLVSCRESIFSDLTKDDINAVNNYLERQADLNIISHQLATTKDSYVFLLEAYRPNKAEALTFLDEGGEKPTRAARVIIYRGDLQPPQVQEYKVWPLPEPSNHAALLHRNWKNPIPFNARSPSNAPQEALMEQLVFREYEKIATHMERLTDGYNFRPNCTGKCLRWFPAMPGASEPGHHRETAYLVRDLEGGYVYPIGLQFVMDMSSVDDSNWSIRNVWFRGGWHDSFDQLAAWLASNSEQVEVLQEPEGAGTDRLSSAMYFDDVNPRPREAKRGPVTYMPDGDRYEVEDGNQIKWLGWQFDFSMLTSSGIQLHEIRFLGERIVYELALQELSVFYSGGSPVASHTNYFDSALVFGHMTSKMFPGIDCPQHARFFDFVHFMNGVPHLFKRGACVFEHDRGVPLRRHYETDFKAKAGYRWAAGMPDNVLIFRHQLTVLNYDYILDFMFHQDGQLEVKLSLNGYVLTTFYTSSDPDRDRYGFRINSHDAIGNLHHHTAHFKVDLDVKGTRNRFKTLDIDLTSVDDSLLEGKTLYNRYITHNLKRTEREAAYKFNFDTPKYLIAYNEDMKNRFNDHKGYRILPEGISKMLLPPNYRGNRSRAWTNYQLAVTRHHDDERWSSSIFTAMEPFDPVMSFDDFINDDENIVDEDLVFWVTLGTHHIPHTEDIPVVSTPGVQLTFFLQPYNYFERDPSMKSRDNIRVVPSKDGTEDEYTYSGVERPGNSNGGGNEPRSAPEQAGREQSSGARSPSLAIWINLAALLLSCGVFYH